MPPRRGSHWFKKTLLALGSFGLALVALEAGSYLLGRFDPPEDPLRSRYVIAGMGQYDHLLFWTLRPGGVDEQGERWINSDGLRGPEIGPKAPGEYRILSLGESTTFARRLAYGECYSALLEERLPGVWNSERPVRVINAGVPGYSLFQGYQYLAHRGLALEPDMVLLYFGHNDFLPVSYLSNRATLWRGETRTQNDWELYRSRQSLRGKLSELLLEHSNAYRGLQEWMQGPTEPDVEDDADTEAAPRARETGGGTRLVEVADETDASEPAVDPDPDSGSAAVDGPVEAPRVPPEHRRRLLALFDELCSQNDVTLVIVVPWYLKTSQHEALLREYALEHGVPLVDLPEVLPARLDEPAESYFSRDLVHPVPGGHELVAEAILEVLAGLRPEPREPR